MTEEIEYPEEVRKKQIDRTVKRRTCFKHNYPMSWSGSSYICTQCELKKKDENSC